jgi:hypothetical protein
MCLLGTCWFYCWVSDLCYSGLVSVVSALWVTLLVYYWLVGFSGKNVCIISGTLLVIRLYADLFWVYPLFWHCPYFRSLVHWYQMVPVKRGLSLSLSFVAFFDTGMLNSLTY